MTEQQFNQLLQFERKWEIYKTDKYVKLPAKERKVIDEISQALGMTPMDHSCGNCVLRHFEVVMFRFDEEKKLKRPPQMPQVKRVITSKAKPI